MSRSNPNDNQPNPAERWFEWNGAEGHFRYYCKEKKERVDLKPDFTFIPLDRLMSVRGWHEPSQSGIVSNEVRNTTEEPLAVKAFKGGKIAAGFYADIKDKVAAAGGHFNETCYCAFKDAKGLRLGAVQFKGAALSAWFEFVKAHRKTIWESAVRVKGSKKDKKGQVVFHVPVFSLVPVSDESNKEAVFMDTQLQEYLKGYFERTRVGGTPERQTAEAERPQADAPSDNDVPDEATQERGEPSTEASGEPPAENDDVPF